MPEHKIFPCQAGGCGRRASGLFQITYRNGQSEFHTLCAHCAFNSVARCRLVMSLSTDQGPKSSLPEAPRPLAVPIRVIETKPMKPLRLNFITDRIEQ